MLSGSHVVVEGPNAPGNDVGEVNGRRSGSRLVENDGDEMISPIAEDAAISENSGGRDVSKGGRQRAWKDAR